MQTNHLRTNLVQKIHKSLIRGYVYGITGDFKILLGEVNARAVEEL